MAGSFLPPVVAEIRADASQYSATMAKVKGETTAMTESGSASMSKFAAIGGKALGVVTIATVALGAVGIKYALDAEVNQARLTKAIQNTGNQYATYATQIDNARASGRALGFSGGDTTQSLTKLTNVTKDAAQAVQLQGLAQDIARGRNIDLATATDILVKVESGRVGLLGRMGINTKDATGATISQTEALDKLSAMYGGQASAYAETFRGKLAILEAQGKYLATSFGQLLLPAVTAVASGLADGANWLDKHRAAALALAIVVGGPLVAAMAAYVIAQASALGSKLADFWLSSGKAAMTAATFIFGSTAAIDTNTASLVVNTGIMEANAVSAESIGAAKAAETAAIAMNTSALDAETAAALASETATMSLAVGVLAPIAAAVALGYAIHTLVGGFDDVYAAFHRGEDAGHSLADMWVTAARKSDTPLKDLQGDLRALNVQHAEHLQALHRDGGGFEDAAQEALRYSTAHKDLAKEIAATKQAHREDLEVTKQVAQRYGVEIPNAAGMSSSALKSMQDAVKTATPVFGEFATQAMLNIGLSGTAIKNLATDAQTFSKSLHDSITQATDPFAHFGTQAAVSETEMEQFFVGSNLKAADWAGEIGGVINRINTELPAGARAGVSGLVQEMAKAGPDSKPALDAFLAMVDKNGLDWAASVAGTSTGVADATASAYAQMSAAAAVSAAEQSAVMMAAQDAMAGHGIGKFGELLNSSDANLRAIAQAALLQMGYTQAAIDNLKDKNVNVTATDLATPVLAYIQANINTLHGTSVDVVVNAIYNSGAGQIPGTEGQGVFSPTAHGAVAMAHGWPDIVRSPTFGLIGERPGSPEMVVPYVNPKDMARVFAKTGHQKDILDAAMQAAGYGMFVPKTNQGSSSIGSSGPQTDGSTATHFHTHTGDITVYAQDGKDAGRQIAGFLNGRSEKP